MNGLDDLIFIWHSAEAEICLFLDGFSKYYHLIQFTIYGNETALDSLALKLATRDSCVQGSHVFYSTTGVVHCSITPLSLF